MLKSVDLHVEYVPRCFRNEMQKKLEHRLSSKKDMGIQADTLRMKKGENGWLIIITWQFKVKKKNVTCNVLVSNYVSDNSLWSLI